VVFAETFESYRQRAPIFMARTAEWKFNYHIGDLNELYDLRNDPLEMVNLAERPGERERVRHMQEVVLEWLRETGDVRVSEVVGGARSIVWHLFFAHA